MSHSQVPGAVMSKQNSAWVVGLVTGGWVEALFISTKPCLHRRAWFKDHLGLVTFLASRFYFFISSPATSCIVTLYAAVPNLRVPGWAGVVLPCLQIDETPSVQSAGLTDESAKPSQSPPSSGFELHLFAIDLAPLVLCSSCAATLLRDPVALSRWRISRLGLLSGSPFAQPTAAAASRSFDAACCVKRASPRCLLGALTRTWAVRSLVVSLVCPVTWIQPSGHRDCKRGRDVFPQPPHQLLFCTRPWPSTSIPRIRSLPARARQSQNFVPFAFALDYRRWLREPCACKGNTITSATRRLGSYDGAFYGDFAA